MDKKYSEYKLNLSKIGDEIRKRWEDNNTFTKGLEMTKDNKPFVFYEGPPSANGTPGIHHVMARTIKDIFCRFQSLKGRHVKRKAGWDTHGLPVEIGVEKSLGITKEDIGSKISVEDYNKACRKEVMKYKDMWDDLTKEMGYWVDLDNPYITFDNKYIESVWWLLSQLYNKGVLYKGYTIQPFSPAAGTGLSTHELNQPGCYRDVKDNTLVAQFKVVKNEKSDFLFDDLHGDLFFLAWTTTPWTLPSNTALAVGKKIDYIKVKTFNSYTGKPITVVLGKDLKEKYFPEKNAELKLEDFELGQKQLPYEVVAEFKGADLDGVRYEQLLPYDQPEEGDAFRVILGDFVTTEDGTGIVHIAPSFGADDFRVAQQNGIGTLTMVEKTGRFNEKMGEFANRFVKPEYEPDFDPKKTVPIDVDIIIKLKKENRAFKSEKYSHSYPHCWRTDKPILYYPLDSWFVKTTDYKERMIELNKTINWKPEATGIGRFGNWLENLVDWNLSRSRFWGIPLPIWTSEDREEQICIGSAEELKAEIDKSIAAGFMDANPLANFKPGDMSKENYDTFDLHRPYADRIILVSPSGKPMTREADLIDVWFDSGSMPYAQLHYPFENKDFFEKNFPADFIAEGVDQTRGWFFTLHAIATMVFDSVAFKTVVSNGLVLDKKGNKMSKRLGNGVDPFETINKFGPDATRWYMITNAQPWDNLKFDVSGIAEVQRKFFGTLFNTYSFFSLYANIDGFKYQEDDIAIEKRPEIDRWILSQLNTLIKQVEAAYKDFEPTRAGRFIQEFLDEHLSNWYVRLCRRRFWKGDYSEDKISAYQTLYRCLEVIAQLGSPIAPFFMDKLFMDLNEVSGRFDVESIHHSTFPVADDTLIDKDLEERMQLAQKISSMVLSLRKKDRLKVRQPLNKIMIPVLDERFKQQVQAVESLILSEVNIKEIEYLTDASGVLVKKIKPDFKVLGPKYGKLMKQISGSINQMTQDDIKVLEQTGQFEIQAGDQAITISPSDVEILTEDIPGWSVANQDSITVALDITLTPELIDEGMARELINKIQNIRKEQGFEVTDRIHLWIKKHPECVEAIEKFKDRISNETLSVLEVCEDLHDENFHNIPLNETLEIQAKVEKIAE
ncbi:MAG: isoleucine--tRNA ligase [Hyphomicrobiales bacterium]